MNEAWRVAQADQVQAAFRTIAATALMAVTEFEAAGFDRHEAVYLAGQVVATAARHVNKDGG
jgi:hypothetical protein